MCRGQVEASNTGRMHAKVHHAWSRACPRLLGANGRSIKSQEFLFSSKKTAGVCVRMQGSDSHKQQMGATPLVVRPWQGRTVQ